MDSDWPGSSINRKSTSGCCFSMRSGVISWFSRNHSYMALSIAEVEYVTYCLASCEEVWMRKQLSNLFLSPIGCYLYILRQLELCELVREPGVP